MGHHYVPQAHLRRFQIEETDEFVWMYDKKKRAFSNAKIRRVAQQDSYYPDEVEKGLAYDVEKPGNIAIEKLLTRTALTNAERTSLALYMLIMATRGPRQRRSAQVAVEAALQTVTDRAKNFFLLLTENDTTSEAAEKCLNEVDAVSSKFTEQLPEEFVDMVRTPFWSEELLLCIHNMNWTICFATPPNFFITSDTPAHIFEQFGIGTQNAEFTFPISSQAALVGAYHMRTGVSYCEARPYLVKQLNRRIISQADRFLFSKSNAAWIGVLAEKQWQGLDRIRWNT